MDIPFDQRCKIPHLLIFEHKRCPFWREIKLTLGWNELAEIGVRHLECKSSLIFFEQKPKVCLKIKSDTF